MRAAQIKNGIVINYVEVDEFTDEWVDPQDSVIGSTWDGVVFSQPESSPEPEPPLVDLPALRLHLVVAVDVHFAAIYARWERFKSEYAGREPAARAVLAGTYEGDVEDEDDWVGAFARSAGLTIEDAAQRIVDQADGLYAALKRLGALRMRKYEITGAEDAAGAQAAHDDIVALATAIAAGL